MTESSNRVWSAGPSSLPVPRSRLLLDARLAAGRFARSGSASGRSHPGASAASRLRGRGVRGPRRAFHGFRAFTGSGRLWRSAVGVRRAGALLARCNRTVGGCTKRKEYCIRHILRRPGRGGAFSPKKGCADCSVQSASLEVQRDWALGS